MNSILGLSPGTFGGVRVIEDIHMTDTVEDWSRCRSISRAKRRHARGIRTAMRYIKVPKKSAYFIDNGRTMVIHPEIAKLLREESKKDPEQVASEAFVRKEKPQPNETTPWRSSWVGSGLLVNPHGLIVSTETS